MIQVHIDTTHELVARFSSNPFKQIKSIMIVYNIALLLE